MKSSAWLLALLTVLAGCGRDELRIEHAVRQTKLPGHIMAGGKTSGEVIAATGAPVQPAAPAGTPGIPQGAEGNVGGTAMGGTTGGMTPQSAGSHPEPGASASGAAVARPPASSPQAEAQAEAEQAALQLAMAQDALAVRVHSRRAVQHGPAPESIPLMVRSEKFGTAGPSADVKPASKPPTYPGVKAKAPDAVN